MNDSAVDPLVDVLARIVGIEHVVTDPDVMADYVIDWSRRFTGSARMVVRPASTDEVAAVVRACVQAGAPLHPQGGNTGLVGGSVPSMQHGVAGAPVVLSTRRLQRCDAVDQTAGQVTVGAGVTLANLRRHATDSGWEYGVDLAGRDSATMGGNLATNAGGIRVCCYGMTRAQVTGIEAVMPDGSVISHLAGLDKDNTGYDLASLLVGSEGTLGVITAARLRLHRPPGESTLVMIGVTNFDEALTLVRGAIVPGVRMLAAEMIDDVGMHAIMALDGLPWPLERPWPYVLVLEVEDGGAGDGLILDNALDVVAAVDPADVRRMWRYREGQGEAFGSLGITHRLDVSIPFEHLAYVADAVRVAFDDRSDVTHVGVFGHLADGNLHVEVIGPAEDDSSADERVLRIVTDVGGSISAEHGVGRQKAPYLGWCRSPAELAAMRAIKNALDPQGLFAPGVIWE